MTAWWSLIGVVAGGFIAAGTAFLLEEVRRRHQRRDKRDDIKREALRRALAWIDPMEKALTAAEVEIYALLHGRIDEEEFRQRYPNLDRWEKTRYPQPSPTLSIVDASYQCSLTIEGIRQRIDELRQQLSKEYRATLD
jgi:hypothetical protein